MTFSEQVTAYLEALAFNVLPIDPREPDPDGLADDRGLTGEQIVLYGAGIVGAGVIGLILWQTLRSGAESVNVPAPQAP